MRLFGARREGGTALSRLSELTAENRRASSPELERRLVRLRHDAFEEIDRDVPAPVPEPDFDAVEWIDGLPVVRPERLSPPSLRAGILAGGCVLLRGLVDPEETVRMVAGIDRAFAARDAAPDGSGADRRWYEPLALGGGAFNLERQRQWVTSAGGVWTADSPRMVFELIEFFDRSGLLDVIAGYIGGRPVASVNKWTLRRVSPGGEGAWHQDGAFLGEGIRAMNVWMALTDCGEEAPGMDVVPRRLERIVATGTPGAGLEWAVSPDEVSSLLDGEEPSRPRFEAGDVLLFDQFFLHRTAQGPTMSRDRYAVETWCFAVGAYPEKQVPLVL